MKEWISSRAAQIHGKRHGSVTHIDAVPSLRSLAERERKWAAFQADPEWIEKRAQTEADGAIVASVENQILVPTAFSSVK